MGCEFSFCARPAAVHCTNCQRTICAEHAIESQDSGEMLCESCAILSKGRSWRGPILVNGFEHSRSTKRARQ